MNKGFLLFCLLVLIRSFIFPQVKIKEKVEIEPHNLIINPASQLASGATFRIEFYGCKSYHVIITGTDYSGTGDCIVEKQNTSGYYSFNFYMDGAGPYIFKKYYGGYLVDSTAGFGMQTFGSGYTSCSLPSITFFRDFNFLSYYPDTNTCGIHSANITIHPVLDNNICEGGTEWDPNSIVNVYVDTDNAAFFNKNTKQLMGNSISGTFDELSYNYYVFSKLPYDAEREYSLLSASSNGITHQYTISLVPQSKFRIRQDEICKDDMSGFRFEPFCGSGDGYLNYLNTNLSIKTGNEYVSFYDVFNEENLGDDITISTANLNKYYLKVDLPPAGDDTLFAVVECEILGNVQSDTVKIIPPPDPYILAASQFDKLSHSQTSELYLMMTRDYCDYSFPQDFTFTAEIVDGGEYGELVDTCIYIGGSGARGQRLEILNQEGCCLIITYDANGVLPESTDSVVFKFISSVEGTAPEYLTIVIEPEPIRVTLNPSNILPGDTAVINLERWNSELMIYEPFPQGQVFDIGLTDGCDYGEILKSDGTRNIYFESITEPVKFIAVDSLDLDSVNVKIKAGIYLDYPYALKSEEVTKDEFKKTGLKGKIDIEKENAKQNKKQELIPVAEDIKKKVVARLQNPDAILESQMGTVCAVLYSDLMGKGEIKITRPELEIILPLPDTTFWITAEPKMPEVICQARLKNYKGGEVNLEWEYWVRYTFSRHAFYTADTLCQRTGMIKITGSSSANNSEITSWIVPFSKLNIDSAEFKAMLPQIPRNPDYGGNCNEKKNNWFEENDIFIGGYVFVQLTAKNNSGDIIGFQQMNAGKILGTNPSPETIQSYANSRELKAIIYHESLMKNERWIQFNNQDNDLYYSNFGWLNGWQYNKMGYPAYGVPNGYGLAKIDNPPPSELDLWNWKHNIDTGRQRLNNAKTLSNKYIVKRGATDEVDKFWMNAFQFYNGGRYWNWIDNKNGWKENSRRPQNNYGKILYQIYQGIN